jgi:hypothetical protein
MVALFDAGGFVELVISGDGDAPFGETLLLFFEPLLLSEAGEVGEK